MGAATVFFLTNDQPIAAAVTFVACTAYCVMLALPSALQEARYSDWVLTTPTIVFVIMQMSERFSSLQTIFVMLSDILMVLSGYAGVKDPTHSLMWWILGAAFFVPVLLILVRTAGSQKAALLSLIAWSLYPLLWITENRGYMSVAVQNNSIAALDVINKVGFGLLIARS